jgi:hypothetical protein
MPAVKLQKMRTTYTLYWPWRYFFPLLVYTLVLNSFLWPIPNFKPSHPYLNYVLEIIILIFATEFLTRKYELTGKELIVTKYLYLRKKVQLKDVTWIEIPKYSGEINFTFLGLNFTVVHMENDKKVRVSMLAKPQEFRESLKSAMENIKEKA